MKMVLFISLFFFAFFLINCKDKANEEQLSQNTGNDFIGVWHDYHRYSNCRIKITKVGETVQVKEGNFYESSFLIEGEGAGNHFCDGTEGVYTLTKGGNIIGGGGLVTIAYDKINNQLIVGEGRWEKETE